MTALGRADAADAFAQAQHGTFERLEAWLAANTGDDPGTRAWRAAMEALHALSTRTPSASVDPALLASIPVDAENRVPLARAAYLRGMAAVAAFDADGLEPWIPVADTFRDLDVAETEACADLLRGWLALLKGNVGGATGLAGTSGELAHGAGAAALVVDAQSLAALAGLAANRLDEALATARRASRMSRTEGLLQQEYLANLVLARVRRRTGQSHLAIRISSALGRVLPATWRTWHAWEGLLSGAEPDERWEPRILEVLRTVANGDLDGAVRARDGLLSLVGGSTDATRESTAFFAAMGIGILDDPATHAWQNGQIHDAPYGARGRFTGTAAAYVMVAPDGRARRVLATALPLARAAHPDVKTLETSRQQDNRSHVLLAVLGLAGTGGMSEADAFQAVYGFPYVRNRHDATFRVLIHRARGEAEAVGNLERTDERLVLHTPNHLLIPDPRCVAPLAERVLHEVAHANGVATAAEIGEKLGLSVRTVRTALAELEEQGAVVLQREGRQVEYRLEDTTFHEPSIQRLARAPR